GVWACAAYVYRAPFTVRRRREEALRFEASKHRYQDKFCGARLRREKFDYRPHCRGDACPNFAPPALIPLQHPLPPLAVTAPPAVNPAPTIETRPGMSSQDHRGSVNAEATLELGQRHNPLVSCIMPTYNRRSFVPQAIRYFLRQDYSNSELVIVDDGTEPVMDCVPDHPRIRYLRLGQKLTIGAKRNFACAQARGEFIIHWDDDDWYPPWRVSAQLRDLWGRTADLCGSSQIFYYHAAADRAWEYRYSAPGSVWVAGNTLAYRKSFWERHKFPDMQIGEDSRFVMNSTGKIVADLADPTLCVGMVHADNTSQKQTGGSFWHPLPQSRIHSLLGDDLYFYRAVLARTSSPLLPLVSCIMPTYNRRSFVSLALQYFQRQDYPNRELIIVDDGSDVVSDLAQTAQNVRYLRLSARMSIGAKRNL